MSNHIENDEPKYFEYTSKRIDAGVGQTNLDGYTHEGFKEWRMNADAHTDIHYYNFTNHNLEVSGKDGIAFRITPRAGHKRRGAQHETDLIISVTISCDRDTVADPDHVFKENDMLMSDYQEALREFTKRYAASVSTTKTNGVVYTVDYRVSVEELREQGGAVYLPDVDVMVTLPTEYEGVNIHPHSHLKVREILESGVQGLRQQDRFIYSVLIISNNNNLGNKFINVNGAVYRIPTISDPTWPEGVYHVTTGELKDSPRKRKLYVKRYGLEEGLSELPIFNSIDDARYKGDHDKIREEERVHAKAAAEQLKADNFRIREENERLKLENDRKRMKLDAEVNSIDTRNKLEVSNNKAFVDLLKTTLTVVSTILTIVALVAKSKN